ncbi:MAG: sigma 54-interacting transcriptional regulator [Solirubrobacterales bacterium]|nr:sigma 54-interacting transcriptional regulator [Solirubrobacterales bacterium]
MNSMVALEALAVAISAGVPVLLWGSPGTGKTSAVVALGEALGWPVETVIGSIREPSDFAGLPVVVDGSVHLSPPGWARRLCEAEEGLLFLDELTTAPPAVQAAMLRVVLERVVGDTRLPPGIRVVAAANPPEQAADGWELAAPLANRLVHLDWPVDGRHIANGLAVGFPQPVLTGIENPPDATQTIAARAAVGAFLEVRPPLALQLPRSAADAGRGWPSPRSWEAVARLLAACEAARASEAARTALVEGAVGDGAALEFFAWLEHLDLPDPEEVLADPDSFVLPERSDRGFAVLTAVASVAIADGGEERWQQAWRVVARAAEGAPDVATLVARTLASHRPAGAEVPEALMELAPVLRASGLLRSDARC